MENLILPFSRDELVLPDANSIVFKYGFNHIQTDSLPAVRSACACLPESNELVKIDETSDMFIVSISSESKKQQDQSRISILSAYQPMTQMTMPLDTSSVCLPSLGRILALKPEVESRFKSLADYCKVGIVVSEVSKGSRALEIHLCGTTDAVGYANYKILVLLNHFYGYSVLRLHCPLTSQSLVSGPDRQHLHTIFQQTGVNMYMPPPLSFGTQSNPGVSVDELYLCGDAAQVLIASKLVQDILIGRLEILVKECPITAAVADIIRQQYREPIEETMIRNAVFVDLGQPGTATIKIIGSSQNSIERTIDALMSMCSQVYTATVYLEANRSNGSNGPSPMSTETLTILKNIAASHLCIIATNKQVDLISIVGTSKQVKTAVSLLGETREIQRLRYNLEVGIALKEFIVGKKHGKIAKIVGPTCTKVKLDHLHDYNFLISLEGRSVEETTTALVLLEGELPAEKWMCIPEAYHRQVIGTGGQNIQALMRKYNVYMRFCNCAGDKYRYPNAFGNVRMDNVLIRCPSKNAQSIDLAANDLLTTVNKMTSVHEKAYVRMTRNHRRTLLANNSNAILEIEKNTHAAMKFPLCETKETQIIEISGLTKESVNEAADLLKENFPNTDYEFRVPWSTRFADVVGPRSDFAVKVSAPLFTAYGAHVQAFERVQMQGDPAIYSQIVVTTVKTDDLELLANISKLVTAYLRDHGLDIVDKGTLRSDPIVGPPATPARAPRLWSTPFGANISSSNFGSLKLNYNDTPVRQRPAFIR